MPKQFEGNLEFDWDKGNLESEEAFLDYLALISNDPTHSQTEARWLLLGKTNNKLLAVIFTLRNKKIRVISARQMGHKERQKYENQTI
ncbi:MAG: hypothetical protein UX99_C0002G0010 [Candidatus Amesbacteria bacterium GW2011_GWB1_47_26]|uniref:Protein containing DUF497 n=1 Tax=Candidatus Amesbacteria bacterium GW2011_GWC2_45_19 TaxID=1618366 RepID=A0A0G1M2Z6_9BACT|nr:MAG: hypothetical protein UX05_C0011G0010 [Candidatus Amesbacteria bacterium GW2011_GWC2_45_19]KKU37865.1 MAG: hypothetical protein UX52_C0016G0016 [Candidatus Amesbacteria bacterium GW2011_GWA1_46_35]KKU69327.1 MAG: hypothetical protein UX93_C0002G0166 [Microgenomates group bacterium GW2011_GWC1_47_20]KKU75039.1 MAG: hypothetical protein UX99_C0002G0010 [Candidatus Amesbacteria bacterium GW2011_GWB1_47_26]